MQQMYIYMSFDIICILYIYVAYLHVANFCELMPQLPAKFRERRRRRRAVDETTTHCNRTHAKRTYNIRSSLEYIVTSHAWLLLAAAFRNARKTYTRAQRVSTTVTADTRRKTMQQHTHTSDDAAPTPQTANTLMQLAVMTRRRKRSRPQCRLGSRAVLLKRKLKPCPKTYPFSVR